MCSMFTRSKRRGRFNSFIIILFIFIFSISIFRLSIFDINSKFLISTIDGTNSLIFIDVKPVNNSSKYVIKVNAESNESTSNPHVEALKNNFKKKTEVFKVLTQGGEDHDQSVRKKRDFIKRMMKDAWDDYVSHAWGMNELSPISKKGRAGGDIFGNVNFGATIIDSLSTLYIMGFDEEFKKARNWVANNFNADKICSSLSLFETNIRLVGGFLSAYALTSDKLFLEKAVSVASKLLPAFDTYSGIPKGRINPCNGKSHGSQISLAELGTLHLEFVYLSSLTGDPIYKKKVDSIRHHLRQTVDSSGLYKELMDVNTGEFASYRASMGGNSDSFYEYLLKSWVQTGDEFALKMYEDAVNSIISQGMLTISKKGRLLYIAPKNSGFEKEFSHLACFSGGMFALGSSAFPKLYEHRLRDLEIGIKLTATCHESYIRSKTGLGPESFSMDRKSEARSVSVGQSYYILRPEVIESYFILYRITRDSKYRDWGWAAAQAIEKHCKVGRGRGYSGIRNVNSDKPKKDDVQQSFFLAETLKYLYLLFSSPELIDLDYWVFNTEAHPLPIKGKNPMYDRI